MKSNEISDAELADKSCRMLEKSVAQWRYMRWLQLLSGAAETGFGGFLFIQAHKLASSNAGDEEAMVYYPLSLILFLLGMQMLVQAVLQWRGDPTLLVLLKLARDSRKEEEKVGLPGV